MTNVNLTIDSMIPIQNLNGYKLLGFEEKINLRLEEKMLLTETKSGD